MADSSLEMPPGTVYLGNGICPPIAMNIDHFLLIIHAQDTLISLALTVVSMDGSSSIHNHPTTLMSPW